MSLSSSSFVKVCGTLFQGIAVECVSSDKKHEIIFINVYHIKQEEMFAHTHSKLFADFVEPTISSEGIQSTMVRFSSKQSWKCFSSTFYK